MIHLYTLNVYSLENGTRAQHGRLPAAVTQLLVSMVGDVDAAPLSRYDNMEDRRYTHQQALDGQKKRHNLVGVETKQINRAGGQGLIGCG